MATKRLVNFIGSATWQFSLSLLFCAACSLIGGEETPPPPPPAPVTPAPAPVPVVTPSPAPVPPPAPAAGTISGHAPAPAAAPVQPPAPPAPAASAPQANINWLKELADFQSADPEKQKAAAQVFLEAGAHGHELLGTLLKNSDQKIVARAKELRQQLEKQAAQVFEEATTQAQKVESEPLTAAALRELQQAWLRAGASACDERIKRYCQQSAASIPQRLKELEDTIQELASLEAQLQALTPGPSVMRASLQMRRANSLKSLQREEEALQAAQAALEAGGKDCRLTPGALKFLGEIYSQRKDHKNLESICERIIKDYPRSLEVKFARQSLVECSAAENRWDDAVKQAKEFVDAFPLDEDAQEQAYSLLGALTNDEGDYLRAHELAKWLLQTLPLDRIAPAVPKLAGLCDEYLLKDLTAAKKMHEVRRDKFTDAVNVAEEDAQLARLQKKADGKFPAEPAENDEGPAGALAKFLKAFRKKDSKAVAAVVPKKEAGKYEEQLAKGEGLFEAVFADFVLTGVKLDDKKESATLTIQCYDSASGVPSPLTQRAIKEDGQWKIEWNLPAAGGAEGGLEEMEEAPQGIKVE